MRILIHIALFAMLAGFLIPSIDGCCCNRFASCTGPDACNIFGCNCDYQSSNYCWYIRVDVPFGGKNCEKSNELACTRTLSKPEVTWFFSTLEILKGHIKL